MNEIFVLDVSLAMNAKREVKDRVQQGLCLCCSNKAAKRGLCTKCHNAYYYLASRMTKRDRAAFEAKLMRQGKLLAAYDKAYRVAKNIFQKLAK